MTKLEEARKKINEIDQQMANLFEARMRAVEDVIQYKKEHHLPILDTNREQFVIAHNLQYIKEEKYKSSYQTFIQDLMATSRKYQNQILCENKVGYQGIEGAFSYFATKKIFPNYQYKNYPSFQSLCNAVENEKIKYAVIPFENSYTGEVGEVLDLLMEHSIYINNIYDLPISQNLLGVKGATIKDIEKVYSKDQAIEQSQLFLKGRGWETIPYPNTAMAAEYVARCKDKAKAAIAAKENAEVYGLEIIEENINTNKDNTTRFIIVSKDMNHTHDRIALAFITNHEAGALAKAMNIIASAGFNMESIKSRPVKYSSWEYYFYIEIDGHMQDQNVHVLLDELANVCKKVKVLGTYHSKQKEGK